METGRGTVSSTLLAHAPVNTWINTSILCGGGLCSWAWGGHRSRWKQRGRECERERAAGGAVPEALWLCLGGAGALVGGVGVPLSLGLGGEQRECLYSCLLELCCVMALMQFHTAMLLLCLLERHLRTTTLCSVLGSRRRALYCVFVCWVFSVLLGFTPLMGRLGKEPGGDGGWSGGLDGLGLGGTGSRPGVGGAVGNWTPSLPPSVLPPAHLPQERTVIGQYLPYGGFLSKIYFQGHRNSSYADLHRGHMGICAAEVVLGHKFLLYGGALVGGGLPLLVMVILYCHTLLYRGRGRGGKAKIGVDDGRGRKGGGGGEGGNVGGGGGPVPLQPQSPESPGLCESQLKALSRSPWEPKPRASPTPRSPWEPQPGSAPGSRALALTLGLFLLLRLPLHLSQALYTLAPSLTQPLWAPLLATFLSHLFVLVPQLLYAPPRPPATPPDLPRGPSRSKRLAVALLSFISACRLCTPQRGKGRVYPQA
ncbi:uncharacterized protein LOC136764068 [Amia ocellicauda]|uniref:uncharacterized protein LOC136764068 n=1 Tax=Amia ocellicauda TaxID=2972642 RepID=UPI00346416C9